MMPGNWLFVALSMVCLDSARVCLSCQTIIWISVLRNRIIPGFCRSSNICYATCLGAIHKFCYVALHFIIYIEAGSTSNNGIHVFEYFHDIYSIYHNIFNCSIVITYENF